MDEIPKTEAEKLDYGFKRTLGTLLLDRSQGVPTELGIAAIGDLDMPLLERFFKAGYRFAPVVTELRALEDEIEQCPAVGYHTRKPPGEE